MSSISQGLVLATAMVISSTALFLAYCRQQKSFPPTQISENQEPQHPEKQILRSCLYSEEKKKERKKKKVQFAEDVKDPSGNGDKYRKEKTKPSKAEMGCRNEIRGVRRMPENRIALYNGILKDRVQRMQCSY